VTVLETLAQPMVRGLGPELGAVIAAVHRDHGVDLRTGVFVEAIEGDDDKRWLGGTGKGLSLAQRLGANSPDDRLALIIGPVLDGYSEPIAGPGRLFGLAPVFADLRLFGL